MLKPRPSSDALASIDHPAGASLFGGGETGALMRAHDWSASPLGPPAAWPRSLHMVVRLMLDSKFPMFVAWGPELGFLYNDAYAEILARKHPAALGARFKDVWAEIWVDIIPLIERALGGEAIWQEDMPLLMNRRGFDERTWFTFSYSPARDDDGQVAGMFCSVAETTQRVMADESMRASEARFEAIANSIDQMVWSTRPDGFHDFYNHRWYEFTGVPSGSTDGEAWAGMFHPDDQERAWATWTHSLETGDRYLIEYRLRHRSGQYKWVLGRAQPVRDALGRIVRWYGTCTDIQEIVEAREVLARSREDLERLVSERTAERDRAWNNAPGLLMVVGADGVIRTVNPGWSEVLGWAGDRLVGQPLVGLLHPEDRASSAMAFDPDHGEGLSTHESRFRCADGSYRWISWKGSRPDGEFVVVGRDVTEEKRRNESLLLHENIVQSHRSPVCAFDTAYRLIAFNRAQSDEFFRVFHRRVRLGDVFPELFPTEQAGVIRGLMARALTGESFTVVEQFGDPALVKPYWEVSYFPLRDEHGQIIGAFHHANDISKRLRATAELESVQDALRQAQKMEAVGQLTGGLAHDFNNLLAGITGSLEVIKRRLDQGRADDLDRFIAMAQGAAKRAAALTHRLLAFSRQQTLAPKPTDVKQLIVGMEDLIRRTVGPSIDVETVHAVGLWTSLIDANELESAVLNLAINARDAMPAGGTITVETANRAMDTRVAGEHGLAAGQYISVSVSDTGTGMPAGVVSRAFDPFFTTKPIGMGTGLGLSMVHGFAKQSGGSAIISSELDKGTMVCVYLPRHIGEPEAEATAEEPTESTFATGECVLVVDDEPSVRLFVVDGLHELGYRAVEAEDGPGALQILRSDARVDLLVSDVGLPGGLNGRQVAEAGRALRPGLKVLFITGYAENAVLNHGHLEPGMQILTKPFGLDVLMNRVQELIGSSAGSAAPLT